MLWFHNCSSSVKTQPVKLGRMSIGHVKDKLGQVKGKIGHVKGKIGQVKGKIGHVKGKIGQVKGKIGCFQGKHGQVKGKIGRVKLVILVKC